MSDIAIRVEGLSKQYRIGGPQRTSRTFREVLLHSLTSPLHWLRGERNPAETFWALDDVSFQIRQGEAVGIIGRNGAGKSTLLKILSRITKPTKGRVDLYGRVASLLEVGTGFHSELSGRDNIYLNGAILGMKRAEIARKFDEIVSFAEVEKFLDTPVKHYSSGMYVRLAFAVAAHLEPEILIVDEVLAVGDTEFQKKCLGKMEDVTRGGRTVLFVSHNMSAIKTLCNSAVLMNKGRISEMGETTNVISNYLNTTNIRSEYVRTEPMAKEKKLHFYGARLLKDGNVENTFYNSGSLCLQIECEITQTIKGGQIAFELLNGQDECIFSSTSQDQNGTKDSLLPGKYVFECQINLNILRSGRYHISIAASVPNVEMLDVLENYLAFDLLDDSSPILKLGQNRRGAVLLDLPWTLQKG
jgi:lipopolysaccharide transport system ATP-binding protein